MAGALKTAAVIASGDLFQDGLASKGAYREIAAVQLKAGDFEEHSNRPT